jgi:hypothetical protein
MHRDVPKWEVFGTLKFRFTITARKEDAGPMSAGNEKPLPEPPDPEQLIYRDVLTYYSSTMRHVQTFEHTLKCLLLIHKMLIAESVGPIPDEDFERLFDQTERSPLGPTLRDLESTLPALNLTPFPDAMKRGLQSLTKLRNRLAHSYLVERSRVLPNPEARTDLIAELKWYAQAFFAMNTRMVLWLNLIVEKLGYRPYSSEGRKNGQVAWRPPAPVAYARA